MLAELLHSSKYGVAIVYVDMRWKARLRRMWGNLVGRYSLTLDGMAFRPVVESDLQKFN